MQKLKSLDRPNEIRNTSPKPFEVKVEVIVQEKETLGKVNFGKPVASTKRISATMEGMVKRKKTRCMSLVKKLEKELCESTMLKVEPRKEG